MSPAPTSKHQYIIPIIATGFYQVVKGSKCRLFVAPFDVTLPIENEKGEFNTVVQPDICVICDPSKITDKGCHGAPDLIVEVVSKSSVKRDLHEKYAIYEQSRVKEYWIVHPNDKTLSVFVLNEEGKYVPHKPLTYGDKVRSTLFPGLEIDLDEVFQDIVEEPEEGYLPEGASRL